LENKFPQTEFAAIASKKVMPSSTINPEQVPLNKDTTLLISATIDTAISNNLTSKLPDQAMVISTSAISIPPISKPKEYREWRKNRFVKN
jgi:hypothetical protein